MWFLIHSQSLRILWKLMKYSQSFLTFKGYSASFMIFGQPRICQLTSLNNFHIIPNRFPFDASPVEKLLQVSTCKIFENFTFFLLSQAVPAGGTETGCIDLFYNSEKLKLNLRCLTGFWMRPWKDYYPDEDFMLKSLVIHVM